MVLIPRAHPPPSPSLPLPPTHTLDDVNTCTMVWNEILISTKVIQPTVSIAMVTT